MDKSKPRLLVSIKVVGKSMRKRPPYSNQCYCTLNSLRDLKQCYWDNSVGNCPIRGKKRNSKLIHYKYIDILLIYA